MSSAAAWASSAVAAGAAVASGCDQAVAHCRGGGEPHVDNDGGLPVGELRPVDVGCFLSPVRGDEAQSRRLVSIGQREPGLGRTTERGGHAGYRDDRDT